MNRFEILTHKAIDDQLTEQESGELAELIKVPGHAASFRGLLRTEGHLRAQLDPPDFVEPVMARIAEELSAEIEQNVIGEITTQQRKLRVLKWVIPLTIAAALLVGIGVTLLTIPSGSSSTGIAKVSSLEGSVQLLKDLSQKEGFRVSVGTTVSPGQTLVTGSKGRLQLEYGDGTTVTLLQLGRMSLLADVAKRGKHIHLEEGALSADVAVQPEGAPMAFSTPEARMEILGTRIRLSSGKGSSRLHVDEGRVRFSDAAGKQSVVVPARHYSVSRSGLRIVAIPESVDFDMASRTLASGRDGAVVWQEDFESESTRWTPLYTADRGDGLYTIVARGRDEVDEAHARIIPARLPSQTGNVLALDSRMFSKKGAGAMLNVPAWPQSFSVGFLHCVPVEPDMPGSVNFHLAGITPPPGGEARRYYGALSQVKMGRWIHSRMDYVYEQGPAGKIVLDIKGFQEGQLFTWMQMEGDWLKHKPQLYFFAAESQLLLDEIVCRKLASTRVRKGLVSAYLFNEGEGQIIRDVSGSGLAMDLRIGVPAKTQWLEQGLELKGDANIVPQNMNRFAATIRESAGFTFECWLRASPSEYGARRYALVDFTRQQDWLHLVHIFNRADEKNVALMHYLVTITRSGRWDTIQRIYNDGKLMNEARTKSTLTIFALKGLRMVIPGKERPGEIPPTSPWVGDYYFMAFYDRALSLDEIQQNHRAGLPKAVTDVRQE